MEVVFTDFSFEQEVLKSDMPVLIDFWAAWCAPCRAVSPLIEELANEYAGKVKIGKMNVDENQETPGTYSVMSIPTVMIFKKGQVAKTLIGVQSKDVYKKNIEEVLGSV